MVPRDYGTEIRHLDYLSKTGRILSKCATYVLHVTCVCSISLTLLMHEGATGFYKTRNNLLFVTVFMCLCLLLLFFCFLFFLWAEDGVLVGSYKSKWMKFSLFDLLRERCPGLTVLISNKPLNCIKSIQKEGQRGFTYYCCKDWKHWILYVPSDLPQIIHFFPNTKTFKRIKGDIVCFRGTASSFFFFFYHETGETWLHFLCWERLQVQINIHSVHLKPILSLKPGGRGALLCFSDFTCNVIWV